MRLEFGKLAACGLVAWGVTSGFAISAAAAQGVKACSATAKTMLQACRADGADNYAEANAICLNESPANQADCFASARSDRKDQAGECQDQYDARTQLCGALGEDRYDPDFSPANFVSDFTNPGVSNPYQPLAIGDTWDYESATETDHVEVTSATKAIEGVTCLVLHDQVSADGKLTEDTDDWIALANGGNAWYCGEETKDYEYFDGDQPQTKELVDIEGSFKAGREGAKPGILVMAAPTVGQTFRQEFSLGNAEDAVEVLSTNYVFGQDPQLDTLVPQALADHLCGAGCVVTREFTPLEPDDEEHKYYAPGIGVFLEVDAGTGEVNRLVGCNFDSRCASLPQP